MTPLEFYWMTAGALAVLAVFDWLTVAVMVWKSNLVGWDLVPAALRERILIAAAIALGASLLFLAAVARIPTNQVNVPALLAIAVASFLPSIANAFWLVRYFGDGFDDGRGTED